MFVLDVMLLYVGGLFVFVSGRMLRASPCILWRGVGVVFGLRAPFGVAWCEGLESGSAWHRWVSVLFLGVALVLVVLSE